MKKKLIILYSLSILIIGLSVYLILVFGKGKPSFVKPSFDPAALSGQPSGEIPGYDIKDIDGHYRVGLTAHLVLEDHKVAVFLTSLPDNRVWVKARILDGRGELVGETGLVKPGYYVKDIDLGDRVLEPGTSVVLKVMAYEPETYYSAGSFSVQTEILEAP